MKSEKNPIHWPIRKHVGEIKERVNSLSESLENMVPPGASWSSLEYPLTIMFGNGIRNVELSPEELDDIRNFFVYASKRLEAGALSSRAYHQVLERKGKETLDDWAPQHPADRGHDVMHAMLAYMRTGGKSLIPAYMQVSKPGDELKDPSAMYEEELVDFYSSLSDKNNSILESFLRLKKEGVEDPIHEAILIWERFVARQTGWTEDQVRANRLPEFETTVRNLCDAALQDSSDPKLAIHEFQRILRPLLERLRKVD